MHAVLKIQSLVNWQQIMFLKDHCIQNIESDFRAWPETIELFEYLPVIKGGTVSMPSWRD